MCACVCAPLARSVGTTGLIGPASQMQMQVQVQVVGVSGAHDFSLFPFPFADREQGGGREQVSQEPRGEEGRSWEGYLVGRSRKRACVREIMAASRVARFGTLPLLVCGILARLSWRYG